MAGSKRSTVRSAEKTAAQAAYERTPAQIAFLTSEAMPALKWPQGKKANWDKCYELAQQWLDEITRRSLPISDHYGLMYDHALLKVVRRGLASDNIIEVHALRAVLSIAQEALVRFRDEPCIKNAKRKHLRQPDDDGQEDDE